MEHSAHTEEIKAAARTKRRIDDKWSFREAAAEATLIEDGSQVAACAGRFRFVAAHRVVDTDYGITINVFGPRGPALEEVLRFDCFANQPHYHLGWSYFNKPFVPIKDSDPLGWVLGRLSNLGEFLEIADAAPMTAEEEQLIRRSLPEFEAKVRKL